MTVDLGSSGEPFQGAEGSWGPSFEREGAALRIPIDIESLADAIQSSENDVRRYLHLGTGSVLWMRADKADPTAHEVWDRSRHVIRIDPVSRNEQYRWLVAFAESVRDRAFARQLGDAIQGPRSFRQFRALLADRPEEREAWYSFREQRVRAAAQRWLKKQRLVAIPFVPAEKRGVVELPSAARSKIPARERFLGELRTLNEAEMAACLEFAQFLLARGGH